MVGIIVAIILFLLAMFLIIYLLLALLSLPIRALPREADEFYAPYIFEPATNNTKWSQPQTPEGMQYRSVPLFTSTNMINWETVWCQVDSNGGIHAPDGAVLQLRGSWDDEAQAWVEMEPKLVVPGRSEMRVFRLVK
jgi:hypothetical protein